MRPYYRPIAALVLVALLSPLASCAGGRKRGGADTSYVARDVNTL